MEINMAVVRAGNLTAKIWQPWLAGRSGLWALAVVLDDKTEWRFDHRSAGCYEKIAILL
jgi:hypothetical protein